MQANLESSLPLELQRFILQGSQIERITKSTFGIAPVGTHDTPLTEGHPSTCRQRPPSSILLLLNAESNKPYTPTQPMSDNIATSREPITRTAKACIACRIWKVRCQAVTPEPAESLGLKMPCFRCEDTGVRCEYSSQQRKRGPILGTRRDISVDRNQNIELSTQHSEPSKGIASDVMEGFNDQARTKSTESQTHIVPPVVPTSGYRNERPSVLFSGMISTSPSKMLCRDGITQGGVRQTSKSPRSSAWSSSYPVSAGVTSQDASYVWQCTRPVSLSSQAVSSPFEPW